MKSCSCNHSDRVKKLVMAFGGEDDPPPKSYPASNPRNYWNVGLPQFNNPSTNEPASYQDIQDSQFSSNDTYDLMYHAFQDSLGKFKDNYDKINKPIPVTSSTVDLTEGKFNGAKVPSSIIDNLVSAAKKQGVDPYTMLALAGQETTFKGYAKGVNEIDPQGLISNWDAYQDNSPYNYERFLADNKVPGVKSTKSNFGYTYEVADEGKTRKYLNSHPELLGTYLKKLSSSKSISMNVLEEAAAKIKKKGISSYNPNDKNYEKDINDSIAMLKKDKNLKKYLSSLKMATGGEITPTENMLSQVPSLVTQLSTLFDNTNYSDQPIINASVARSMVSPYSKMMALGGSIDDLSDEEYQQIQAQAEQMGIDPQDLLDRINAQDYGQNSGDEESLQNDDDDTEEGDSFATGGWIKKAAASIKRRGTEGKCTPITKPGCTGRARALALTFKKIARNRKHAYGGGTNADVEVEGNEIVQPPGMPALKVKGPKHEDGGVNLKLPENTRVYSDRLKVDGLSMQQRKANREKRLSKLNGLLEKDPTNKLLKNTIERTNEHLANEDAQDMALQNVAKHIYAPPTRTSNKSGYGGYSMKKVAAYGDDGSDIYDLNSIIDKPLLESPSIKFNTGTPSLLGDYSKEPNEFSDFTTGDYIGMAGTLFNSIAPIINSRNAARNTRPIMNRYRGFGQKALDANTQAQDYASRNESNALTDIDTDYNTATASNRNSSNNVNTSRALDIASGMSRDKAKTGARSALVNQMIGILGQRGQLSNQQDYYQDMGETNADVATEQQLDNLYSNRASNLINLGSGIEKIGADFNTAKSNVVDRKLLSELSQYGLGFDEDGNLISTIKNG